MSLPTPSRAIGSLLVSLLTCGIGGNARVVDAQGPTSASIARRILDDSGRGLQGRMEVPSGVMLTSTSQVSLLSQVGATAGSQGQPVYRFDPTRRYDHNAFDSYYQVQLAVRYSF